MNILRSFSSREKSPPFSKRFLAIARGQDNIGGGQSSIVEFNGLFL